MKHRALPTRLAMLLGVLVTVAPAAADPPPPPRAPKPGWPLRGIMRPLPRPTPPAVGAPATPAPGPAPAAPTTNPAPATTPLAPAQAAPAPRPARRKVVRPKPPPPPAGPPPDVRLSVDAPTRQGTWTLRVTNAGSVPVRLAADARLLALDVTPRGERRPVHCELPADMRPDDDLDRSLVLPPGRSYAESFEPRLYCFGERALQALSPQAIVVARLGWPAGSRAEDRQAVSSIDGVEPVVGSLPSIVSTPFALPDDPTPAALPAEPPAGAIEPPRLRVTGAVSVDAATFDDLTVAVTLHNDGTRPVRLRFKPETLAFDVATSRGVEHCAWPTPVGAPMRELYSTLAPGQAETQQVLLSDYCNAKPLDHAGLIVVRPQLDTRRAGGQDIGLQTFDGQIIATEPTVARLHRGTSVAHLARPHLEPTTSSE